VGVPALAARLCRTAVSARFRCCTAAAARCRARHTAAAAAEKGGGGAGRTHCGEGFGGALIQGAVSCCRRHLAPQQEWGACL